ncbi:RNA polymerase sigma factor [Paenibacillus macquariensis]|uniref:RNA polymerase sigma factor n=1 Tax=Paenibacillus macquariensis TaxID=948756 RepID=UPI002452EB7E|nr:sigma-70 family RNA polymerase sigma factor [Paenibacillus macquariensis]MEC0094376.1 sigma-70 family RNA polymerase sigma factor [Paenibacillus macquariensis]
MKNDLQAIIADYVTENQEKIYRLAYHYVQNQADALDIMQDAIMKAISKQETIENPAYIKTWFYRIVVNTALDLLRKQKKEVVVAEDILAGLDRGEVDRYKDEDLFNSLDKLPQKYRSVVILKYFENLKLDEIAQVLNENISTVKTRLYKALQLLRIELSEEVFQS